MRGLAIAGITVLAVVATALADPSFFRFLRSNEFEGSARNVPYCPDVIGAERVKLPCLTRVVRGLPPPQEAAAPDPALRGEP